MAKQSDTRRRRSLEAEFDDGFSATAHGGGALAARVMRRLGMAKLVGLLPERAAEAKYKTAVCSLAMMASLLLGRRGIGAAELLREDALLAEVFDLRNRVPEEATMHRALCDIAGLEYREFSETYESAPVCETRLDMFGNDKTSVEHRRIVPEEPEFVGNETLTQLHAFESAVASRCAKSMKRSRFRLRDVYVLFGDATDLEVRGDCFDAARRDHNGNRSIRAFTVSSGPLTFAHELAEGATYEAATLPRVLERGWSCARRVFGKLKRYLSLLDTSFFEKRVLDWHAENNVHFIIGANKEREHLTKLAVAGAHTWCAGATDRDRFEESQVTAFSYKAESWDRPVTIIARRYRKKSEMPGTLKHYYFIATNLEEGDLPHRFIKKYGYCEAIWRMYGTKQGHENNYKTPLSDLGLHHPPSGRIGIDQVYYTLGFAAANIAAVMSHAIFGNEVFAKCRDRAIRLWRMREKYFRIPGYLVRQGGALIVRLAGGDMGEERKRLWDEAWRLAARI